MGDWSTPSTLTTTAHLSWRGPSSSTPPAAIRSRRLVYSQNAGNGGTYEYLVCTARQHKQCSMPWLRVEQIEAAVLPVVAQEQMTPESIEGIRESVSAAIANILAEDRDVKAQL